MQFCPIRLIIRDASVHQCAFDGAYRRHWHCAGTARARAADTEPPTAQYSVARWRSSWAAFLDSVTDYRLTTTTDYVAGDL